MVRKSKTAAVVDTDLALAAACAAYRIQVNQYVKVGETRFIDGQVVALKSNKQYIMELISDPTDITDLDRDQAKLVRAYYQSLTFRLLSGKYLPDLDNKAMSLAQDDVISKRDLGLIAYLPRGYESAQRRRAVDERLSDASGPVLAKLGQRVTVQTEIVRCYYSENYGVYFITALTDGNSVVSCSSRNKIEPGTRATITGTVKGYRENQTQLSRPRIDVAKIQH
jgi:hypothetical protein